MPVGILTSAYEDDPSDEHGRPPVAKGPLDAAMARQGYDTYADLLNVAIRLLGEVTQLFLKHATRRPRLVFEGSGRHSWFPVTYTSHLERGQRVRYAMIDSAFEGDTLCPLYLEGEQALLKMLREGWFASSGMAIQYALLTFLELEQELSRHPDKRVFVELDGTQRSFF